MKSFRNLTLHYSLYQLCYFTVNAATVAFATSYLLHYGFSASSAGLILALTSILSCLLQPAFGSFADHRKDFILPDMLAVLIGISIISFGIIGLFHPVMILFGTLYVIGGLCQSITVPLSNSLVATCNEAGYPIDFGIGAGVGSLSYSFASLIIGYIMALLGADGMIRIAEIFMIFQLILVLRYPRIDRKKEKEKEENTLSLWKFFGKNRMFTITLTGVLFLAMTHSMLENYLINLFQTMKGNSQNVGIALFLACISAAPFLLTFEKIQKKTGVRKLMRLAGLFYMIKGVILYFSFSIWHVYVAELLQICTYAFLYPSLYYFAKESVPASDMSKGQSVTMAFYTLGLAAGSWIGGEEIDLIGIHGMYLLAIVFAAIGTLIINCFLSKTTLQ